MYQIQLKENTPQNYEMLLSQGINDDAINVKGVNPTRSFGLFIEDESQNVIGGTTCVIFFGSLYIDMLWVDSRFRKQQWGTKLMQEAEKIAKENGCTFATLNTMDWEALNFYQKLGYSIEFTREGYEKNSKMYMLRKKLRN